VQYSHYSLSLTLFVRSDYLIAALL